ncbi:hypothetical protein GGF45_003033, partial [Coemansia sp. RSA 551]
MAVMGDPSDEGFDDCFPLRTPPLSASKSKAAKSSTALAAESHAMESLAQALQ